MGYDVHITRAGNWAENQGREIAESEWHAVIGADPELRLAGCNGPHFAIWEGHPEDDEAWLDWFEGNVFTKNPDEPLVGKMREIAQRLDAKVQGDDGEIYDSAAAPVQAPAFWGNTSLLALILSFIALAIVAVVFPTDLYLRQYYPVGTPRPMHWVIPETLGILVAILAWITSTVFAVAALVRRQNATPNPVTALVLNVIFAVFFALMD